MTTTTATSEYAPGTYTVRFTYGRLSSKRFRDAVDAVKKIGGRFDSATKTWTVTFTDADDVIHVASELRVLARNYDADVTAK